MKISKTDALKELEAHGGAFKALFGHGSLQLEIYRPEEVDLQQPHSRDEVYIVISGSGEFLNGEDTYVFGPGDFLFVPAGTVHKFKNFTEDFATWVIFYGPEGREKNLIP